MPEVRPDNKIQVGGQAVIEGVMMRSKNFWALSVRKPDKTISTQLFKESSPASKNRIFGFFIIRGVASLISNLLVGFKALSYSANESTDSEIEFSKKDMLISTIIAVVFAVGVFFVLPTVIGKTFFNNISNIVVYNILEGLVRIGFFLVYIIAVSQIKDIKRVFQYHGAEHKSINAYENGEELKPENVKKYSTINVRCGTSFLMIVMIIAIFVFSLLGKQTMLWRILSRVLLVPVIAGISYEFIMLAGKFNNNKLIRALLYPGLLLQKITTREPDIDQIEVAIDSLNSVLEAEKLLALNV
ncbi:MAG: DUF1385 domain-containing protein [Actinomycetota bacterium]|nr:DUF1385 domain-containing protein [Actinomycetota bacterium]